MWFACHCPRSAAPKNSCTRPAREDAAVEGRLVTFARACDAIANGCTWSPLFANVYFPKTPQKDNWPIPSEGPLVPQTVATPSISTWRSLGDSNPCFRRERATSWAARRREPERSNRDSLDPTLPQVWRSARNERPLSAKNAAQRAAHDRATDSATHRPAE